jgi:hypothetical protein
MAVLESLLLLIAVKWTGLRTKDVQSLKKKKKKDM